MQLIRLHFRGFILAISKIVKHPVDHLLNILTISAIITALCAVLLISKSMLNLEQNSVIFPQIIIYLDQNAKPADISNLENLINKHNQKLVKGYQFISKTEGLQQLSQDDKLKQIASNLQDGSANPLPDVLIVNTNTSNLKHLQELSDKIRNLPLVDEVQMDDNYAGKISDLMGFIQYVSILLQVAFAVILVIVIYNLIRLQMLLRQDEILVSRLIGASDSFIMRPLAYYAVLQVIISAGVAFFLVNLFISFLNNLFLSLNNLFGNNFIIPNLSAIQFSQLLAVLVVFTVFAVFMAVQWVFKNIHAK
jgi:cell division transport system permease protein